MKIKMCCMEGTGRRKTHYSTLSRMVISRMRVLAQPVSVFSLNAFLRSPLSPSTERRKDKGKDLPPDLQALWEKDRKAKAEHKKAREQARLENAADPMAKKKRRQERPQSNACSRRAGPHHNCHPESYYRYGHFGAAIRRFIADIGGPPTHVTPTDQQRDTQKYPRDGGGVQFDQLEQRARVMHGTPLFQRQRGADFAWMNRRLRRSYAEAEGWRTWGLFYTREEGQGCPSMPRHREGDEVGKARDYNLLGVHLLLTQHHRRRRNSTSQISVSACWH